PRDALIDCNAVQPGRNLCLTTKTAQVAESCKKRFLRCIPRIIFATQHPKSQRKYAPFPAAHNLAERLGVTRQGAFHHLLVRRGRIHLVRTRAGREGLSKCEAPATQCAQVLRRWLRRASLQKYGTNQVKEEEENLIARR